MKVNELVDQSYSYYSGYDGRHDKAPQVDSVISKCLFQLFNVLTWKLLFFIQILQY